MAPRVRIVRVTIAVDAVLDDGDTLEPMPVEPMTLTWAQATSLDWTAALAALQPVDAPDE